MKAFLMHSDRDFNPNTALPPNMEDLAKDLELNVLFGAMAAEDDFLLKLVKVAIPASLHEPEGIIYRQRILADCLERAAIVREMYGLIVDTVEAERKIWGWGRKQELLLHHSLEVLQLFIAMLKKLRHMTDEHAAAFQSEGFTRLFATITAELDDAYIASVEDHLRRLRFKDGILMSVELGEGMKGANHILRKPPDTGTWLQRLHGWVVEIMENKPRYVYEVSDQDEIGLTALSEMRGQGITGVAVALAQSTDHIRDFFKMLRLELGFYVGCLNLHDKLAAKGNPFCFPEPVAAGKSIFSGHGLYDVCLSLSMEGKVMGNQVGGDGKTLLMITGTNRGGKSTFLRSAGLAQLMMQCGMFVPAESFRADIRASVFTHFKREEDTEMKSGKLDEELARMSKIVDQIVPNSLMLFNESFASTNEREGSEIARQIVRALLENGVKVFYVTHMFDLAQGFYLAKMRDALFLRAPRERMFQLAEGEPLPTSYGEDLFKRIFENSA